MSTKKSWVLGSLLASALSVAATSPVAMRVEVEPIRQVGDATAVTVVVQVSPEDRLRIGSNAILRIELDGGKVSSGSPMRAVRLEDDGSVRVVVEWPPGEHHLSVGIEDPSKEDTGLWVGTVRIPDLSLEGAPVPVADPEPEPEPDPAPVPMPTPESEKRQPAAPDPVPEPIPVPVPSKPEPMTPAPTETEVATDTAVAAAGASTVAELPTKKIEPESEPVPEPEPEPELEQPVTPPETESEVVDEKPLVEPLRSDPQAGEPEATSPRQQAEPAPASVTVSADLAARYEEWGSADPDTREFSVVMLRGREPATGIDVTGLRLRVGGSEVPVERLGDVERAPLLLGLAIDVVPDEIDGWSGMQGSLAPIVERAGDGRGRLFVASPSGVDGWDAEPALSGRAGGSSAPMNITQLVVASLERFEGQLGRTFLVVLTDGRNEPSKDEWRQATDSAGAAGVPILVVALWDDDFNNRSRKNLKKLTEISGGSLFLVQGRAQLESAADRFGRYLDGGYSIRFKSPGGDRQTMTTISVSASDKEVDVSAPKSIR